MFEVPNWKVTHFILKKPIKLSILALHNVSVSHFKVCATASQVGTPTNANIVTSLHRARL